MKAKFLALVAAFASLAPAQAQQPDMAAMQKWMSAKTANWHIVGRYEGDPAISSDGQGLEICLAASWQLRCCTIPGKSKAHCANQRPSAAILCWRNVPWSSLVSDRGGPLARGRFTRPQMGGFVDRS